MDGTAPQARAKVRSALHSAQEALTAVRHALEDFESTNEVDRRVTAFRNFVSNGFSVTQMLHRIKTVPHAAATYSQWYPAIAESLRTDPAAAFFWAVRTAITHQDSRPLSDKTPLTFPVDLRSVRLVVKRVGSGIPRPVGAIGVTPSGAEVYVIPSGPSVVMVGTLEDPDAVAAGPMMRPYYEMLANIVSEAHQRFGAGA